jgi:uncharacterized protein DUF5670
MMGSGKRRANFVVDWPTTSGGPMLWTIFVILLMLWLLGIVSANTFGGFIHVLLTMAIAMVLLRVIQGERPTK